MVKKASKIENPKATTNVGRKKKAKGENIIRLNLYAKSKYGEVLVEKFQPIIDKEVIKLDSKEAKP